MRYCGFQKFTWNSKKLNELIEEKGCYMTDVIQLLHLTEIAEKQKSKLQNHRYMVVLFLCFSSYLLSGHRVSSSPSTNLTLCVLSTEDS